MWSTYHELRYKSQNKDGLHGGQMSLFAVIMCVLLFACNLSCSSSFKRCFIDIVRASSITNSNSMFQWCCREFLPLSAKREPSAKYFVFESNTSCCGHDRHFLSSVFYSCCLSVAPLW